MPVRHLDRRWRGIIGERIVGASDLAVEVLTPRTARRDRPVKGGWYRHGGVAECWLVDGRERCVDEDGLRRPLADLC